MFKWRSLRCGLIIWIRGILVPRIRWSMSEGAMSDFEWWRWFDHSDVRWTCVYCDHEEAESIWGHRDTVVQWYWELIFLAFSLRVSYTMKFALQGMCTQWHRRCHSNWIPVSCVGYVAPVRRYLPCSCAPLRTLAPDLQCIVLYAFLCLGRRCVKCRNLKEKKYHVMLLSRLCSL